MRTLRSLLLAVSLTTTSGCSMLFVPSVSATPASPPEQRAAEAASCKEARLSPNGDVGLAVLWGVVGALTVNDAQAHQACFIGCVQTAYNSNENTRGVIMLGAAAVHIVSAIIGYSRTNDCAALRQSVAAQPRPPMMPPPGMAPLAPPPPHQGAEREACFASGGCDPGLDCFSGLCVRLAPPPMAPATPPAI